jgi:probable DNA metabolism protein
MRIASLDSETDFDGWREAARGLRLAGVPPSRARFVVRGAEGQGGLFDDPAAPGIVTESAAAEEAVFTVPKAFVDAAREVILHRSLDRFDLMYRLLWRLRDEPDLMKIVSDPDVADAMERAKNVSRASHKMKAFVRFRQVEDEAGEAWVAWFEPAHRVLEKTAPFFVNRFTTMRWSILTPDGSAFWSPDVEGGRGELSFGPPATADQAPAEDEVEEFWKTYYASTFNPARLKTRTMQGEMPKRYWKNLPEASLIPELVAASAVRTEAMVATPHSEPNPRLMKAIAKHARDGAFEEGFSPSSLAELDPAVQGCRRCPLYRDATQGVCGVGPARAKLMIVGEQPGDQEDLAGRPFVGPAGQVLDEALSASGIDRDDVYLTNAVKHFKHEPRGKRRLHRTPTASEVTACRWWLDHERRLVGPKVILALGATAALGVLGRKVAVTEERGRPLPLSDGSAAFITTHPAYLLRLPDEEARRLAHQAFTTDLRAVRALL